MALTAEDLTPDEARLADLKQYMNVTWDEDDALIGRLYGVAVSYLANAGVVRSTEDAVQQALYDQAVDGLTLNYFDRRGAEVTGTVTATMEFGLRLLVNQLKLSSPVSNLDTDTT
jgi:hypothetical protein